MKFNQATLFDITAPKAQTLGEDPDNKYSQRKKRSDLEGQRYLVPNFAPKHSTCGKCGAGLIEIELDGKRRWLDASTIKPAGRNARTARLHNEMCLSR